MAEGWCPVEALTLRGFGCPPVMMANETHSGLARTSARSILQQARSAVLA